MDFLLSIKPFYLLLALLWLAFAIPTLKATTQAPYVPTPQEAVRKMVHLAKLKAGMKIIDPGCGDARILAEARRACDVEAHGYELFLLPYLLAYFKNNQKKTGVHLHFRDSRKISLQDFDVLFCYLMPATLRKLAPKWEKELRPGSRVISYAFAIPGWQAQATLAKDPEHNIAPIMLYEIGKQRS